MRLAILSATGTARKRTIPAIRENDICEIVGVHGRDDNKLATLAKEHAIPFFSTNPSELLDSVLPDFVFIGSPPTLHEGHIQLCLERKIPVLCEKPLCLTTAQADRILALSRKHGAPVRVAHHLRHQAGTLFLKRLIDDASLGISRRLAMQWGFWLHESAPNASWKLTPELGGSNAFFDAGIHAVDLMLYLLPKPTQLVALGIHGRFSRTMDNVSMLAVCDSAIAELSCSQAVRSSRNALTLDFEAGSVLVDRALGETAFTRLQISDASGTRSLDFPQVNPYAEEIRDFMGLLGGASSRATTLEEARSGIQILEAISSSLSTRTVVHLQE